MNSKTANKSKKPQAAPTKKDPAVFTKKQILRSKRYADRKDAVSALLDASRKYSLEEVDALLNEFYGKRGNR